MKGSNIPMHDSRPATGATNRPTGPQLTGQRTDDCSLNEALALMYSRVSRQSVGTWFRINTDTFKLVRTAVLASPRRA